MSWEDPGTIGRLARRPEGRRGGGRPPAVGLLFRPDGAPGPLRAAARRREAVEDEEDAALNAFDSFCRGLSLGRFDQLRDRDALWRLLAVLTVREARDQLGARPRGSGAAAGQPPAGRPALRRRRRPRRPRSDRRPRAPARARRDPRRRVPTPRRRLAPAGPRPPPRGLHPPRDRPAPGMRRPHRRPQDREHPRRPGRRRAQMNRGIIAATWHGTCTLVGSSGRAIASGSARTHFDDDPRDSNTL